MIYFRPLNEVFQFHINMSKTIYGNKKIISAISTGIEKLITKPSEFSMQ